MKQPLISIVVLNWNGKQFLDTCFSSIAKQTFRNFECLLVDNGSTDGSIDFVKKRFPWVNIIALKQNAGFAKGNNVGMKAAKGKYVLTLNNDTRMHRTCLKELAAAIQRHPEAGMFSLKMLFFYEKQLINSTGMLVYADGAAMNRGMKEPDRGQYEREEEILGPCAGAGVYKKRMLQDIQLQGAYFSEEFFIYLEDVELSWRAQLRKWKAYYVPKAIIYHVHSATMQAKSPKKLYLAERNRIWYTFKVLPLSVFLIAPLFTLQRYIAFLRKGKSRTTAGKGNYRALAFIWALGMAWIVGLLGLPRMIRERGIIQRRKKISKEELQDLMQQYRAELEDMVMT